MTWVAHFLLLLFVAVSSGAIGFVLGRESSECRRQWEPPCRHPHCMARRRL